MTPTSEIEAIVKVLRKAAEAYYLGSEPIISDAEYDRKRKLLAEISPNHPFLKEIGANVSSSPLSKVKHFIPMGSLNNLFDIDEFDSWIKGTKAGDPEVVVQWKLDGLSIELVYKSGRFVRAVTRGDGVEGEDVTHTIGKASGFPRNLNKFSKDVSIRCEAVLPIPVWKKNHSDTANPRNAMSGLTRRKSAEGSEDIQVIAFDADAYDDCTPWGSEIEKIEWLTNEGFSPVKSRVLKAHEVSPNLARYEENRGELDYLTDGVVIKINSLSLQETLGEHDGRPKWAKAYKFAAIGEHTVIEDVVWQVGSSGSITPVALVKPVSIGGTTVKRVTLHNLDEVERLNVHIGDEVEIIRAGEVIPKVLRVVKGGGKKEKIECKSCPSCGVKPVRVGPLLKCQNKDCLGSNTSKLMKWIEKRNIMHLGGETLDKLIEGGVVDGIIDLYTMSASDMVKAGVGKVMSEKILGEIEKSRDCTLYNFIGSLSIDMVGRSEAENICDLGFSTVEDFLSLTSEQLVGNKGYKEVKANRIVKGIQDNKKLILSVSKHMRLSVPEQIEKGEKKMSEKVMSICLTGTMSKQRKDIEADIEAAGHTVVDKVNKHTTHLCQADPDSQTSKSKAAVKLGIPIISEEELYELLD